MKATSKVKVEHLKGLLALREEGVFQRFFMVTHDPVDRVKDGIHYVHWKSFLQMLWGDVIIQSQASDLV